jgi:hypothetical protein
LQLRGAGFEVVGPKKRSKKQKVKQAKDDWLKEMMGGTDERDYDNIEYNFDFAYNEVMSPSLVFRKNIDNLLRTAHFI